MYISALDYELKSRLKFPIKMLYFVERSIERCASSISRDNEQPLACCCYLYSNFELLGRTPSKFRSSEQFSYTFIPNNFEPLRKHIFLDVKVNTLQFWSRDGIQIFSSDIVLDLLIGRHLILFLPKNFFPEISWDYIFI